MKICNVFHSRDLDGWMSAAIVKKWFLETNENKDHVPFIINHEEKNTKCRVVDGINLDMLGWDYGDKIPDLSEYDKVIMCDISFPVEKMKALQKRLQDNFIWIDHHISAINDLNNYLPQGYLFPQGLRDPEFAACELTWKYFFLNEEMPEIVRLLGRYDCFGHKGTDEEQKVLEFQYGARQLMANYEDCYKVLVDFNNINTYKSILYSGKSIYQYLCTEAKQIYKKAFEIKLREPNCKIAIDEVLKFLCVNQERFNPINFGIDYHKDGYDGFACFWYKDGKWMWSLYNDNGEIDCSIIAKSYGGGGHKGASGFVCDSSVMLKIINNG